MANDKRFIVKNGLSGPTVRFANGSNTTAVLDFNYGTDGTLNVVGNTNFGTLITINDRGLLGTSPVLTVNGDIAFGASGISVNSTFYEATANNASFAYGKQESQLSVANAVFSTTSANTLALQGATWQSPLGIGTVTPNTGTFTTLSATTLSASGNTTFGGNTTFWANVVFNSNAVFNSGLVANGSLGTAGFVLVSNGTSIYWSNSTAIAGTANNANYLGGFLPAYYTNATNISTGTLAEARLPFRMNQNVRTTDDVTFANGIFNGSVSIGGDLTLTGNLYSTNIQSLSIIDPIIKLAANNSGDALWTGFLAHYEGSGNTTNHTGLLRSPTSKEYILISTYGDELSVNNNIILTNDTSLTYANLAVRTLRLGNTSSVGTLDANSYSGTANNATYAYGKQEAQLSVAIAANAVFATTANNALRFNGKQESQLYVANAVFATTSANTLALQGATWQVPLGIGTVTANTGAFTTLSTSGNTTFSGVVTHWANTVFNANATFNANAIFNSALIANNSAGVSGQILSSNGTSIYWTNANNISGTVASANNASYLNGKQESQLSVNNAVYLAGRTWETAGAIGATVANTGAFSNATFAIANATNYISVRNISHISGDSNTTTAVAQVQISSFSANAYGSAKIYIQATETATTRRHVTELLVVHDNSVASATEYGMLFTGATALATYDVDIVSNNVRILATPASANTIAFRVTEQLFVI